MLASFVCRLAKSWPIDRIVDKRTDDLAVHPQYHGCDGVVGIIFDRLDGLAGITTSHVSTHTYLVYTSPVPMESRIIAVKSGRITHRMK